ncbi:ABC transporter substrate-binding protein [Cohnella sp. GCM10027633]|uniref:ABC transporter substrate-binding protein n=1 Tax=unclassified Cohnella TaxID=2636738 RepID=UPI003645CE10
MRFIGKTFHARKPAAALIALLLCAAVLSACGSNNNGNNGASPNASPSDQASPSASAASPSASASEESNAPSARAVTDALGRTVEIPAKPERIVAHYYASEFTALNVPLLGTNFLNAKLALTEEQLQGIEDVGGEGLAPNLEKLLSLKPDLIVVPDFLEATDIDALAKIAPTVAVSYSADTFSHLRTIADLVGQPQLAEDWIASYTKKSEEKRAEVKPFLTEGETASAFVVYTDGKAYIYNKQRLGPTMYDALGFAVPEKVQALFKDAPDELWKEISLELLTEYAGDRIFLVTPGEDEAGKKALEEVVNGAVWKSLPAVKNGKAYLVTGRWAMNDPLTLDWLLDEMPALLTK